MKTPRAIALAVEGTGLSASAARCTEQRTRPPLAIVVLNCCSSSMINSITPLH